MPYCSIINHKVNDFNVEVTMDEKIAIEKPKLRKHAPFLYY